MSGAQNGGGGEVRETNGRFLRACACGGVAWGSWAGYQHGVDWFVAAAALFAAGALWHGVIAISVVIKFIVSTTKWGRFERSHAKPKADPMADTDAMRKSGLL